MSRSLLMPNEARSRIHVFLYRASPVMSGLMLAVGHPGSVLSEG